MNQNIYKLTWKMVLFIIASILACRFSNGITAPVFVAIGVACAFMNLIGWSLVFFVLMPFFIILNPALMPKDSLVFVYSMRFGPLLIGLCLALMGASRKGYHRLPLLPILPFLIVAFISSLQGWVPTVSILKLFNFIVFLFGIWFGTQNLQDRPKDVFLLRAFFLALASILILGSVMSIPFPSIAYRTSLGLALREGGEVLAEETFIKQQAEGMISLFCGVTNHSQALAPLLACAYGWVACDMLFVERRFRVLHLILIGLCFPLEYMTRSRVGLVSMVIATFVVYFYVTRHIKLVSDVKNRLSNGMLLFLICLLIGGVVGEIRDNMLTRWIRKTNDVSYDKRSLVNAVTETRHGLMEYSLWEFKRNPMIGSGFQVAEYTRDNLKGQKGLIVTAPIEKGVLPVMVLGETGVLGEITFLFFIFSFYFICTRRSYYVTITTFTILLCTNAGEATFFSPGGGGGIMWMICVVGGFTIDTFIIHWDKIERSWQNMGIQMAAPMWEEVEDASGRKRLVESTHRVKRYGMKG